MKLVRQNGSDDLGCDKAEVLKIVTVLNTTIHSNDLVLIWYLHTHIFCASPTFVVNVLLTILVLKNNLVCIL